MKKYQYISDSIYADTDISVIGQYWLIILADRYISHALVLNLLALKHQILYYEYYVYELILSTPKKERTWKKLPLLWKS